MAPSSDVLCPIWTIGVITCAAAVARPVVAASAATPAAISARTTNARQGARECFVMLGSLFLSLDPSPGLSSGVSPVMPAHRESDCGGFQGRIRRNLQTRKRPTLKTLAARARHLARGPRVRACGRRGPGRLGDSSRNAELRRAAAALPDDVQPA